MGSDQRAIPMDTLEVSIRARAKVKDWVELVRAACLRAGGDEPAAPDYSAHFYALPAVRDGDMFLTGDLRPGSRDGKEAHLRLRWEMMPEGPAPRPIKVSSRRVGGWPTALQRIAEHWPGPKVLVADVNAMFVMDPARYKLRPALALKRPPASVRKPRLTQTAAAWNIEPTSGPVSQISVAVGQAGEIVLATSGTHEVMLEPEIVGELRDAAWAGIEPFVIASVAP